ncbi:hypothetical protein [Paenibacillus qinlingensis]|uniref:Uncharacterized protein n=1 Tax=Paenibacillus qinlingensis TaxID=1837343 RepID=A0ABU1NTU2_9BACL|nr:hypothetical protein [Paenibacillus qinlingensis]MDR6550759.1 hypothetical protein [Paenibacillus qinlingensis]
MRKTLSIVLIVFVTAFFYGLYRFGQFDSKIELSVQLENIIHEHDPAKIQTISLDQTTNEYLLQLPKNTKAHKTSDFQGGSKEISYLATLFGDRPLHVYMKVDTQSNFHKLFPKWTLLKVSVAPNGILPSIPELEESN